MTKVLIVGAGIAGSTLAYWLARKGLEPTVVERHQGLRSSGNPVDVRGTAVPVAEAMGVMPRLRELATHATGLSVLDPAGKRIARLRMGAGNGREVEVARTDLAEVLYEAASPGAEFLFDDTIVDLVRDGDGVEVTFDRAAPRRFDLVVGADGLHSTVRRMVLGPERDFVRHAGLYVATLPLGEPAESPTDVVMYNTPGRLVAIHPVRGESGVAFIFRGSSVDLERRDQQAHKQFVASAYAGIGWRVPEMLKRLDDTKDMYFDAVSQVRLDTWTRGRVTLLGDAASCVSLLGDGSSNAIVGAQTLAIALAESSKVDEALRRYESLHRKVVGPKQRGIGVAAAVLVPRTRIGLATRNLVARIARRV